MEPTQFQKIILGIVQGLTEFLPISSSAHLILVPNFFHWPDPGLAFDVALHLGTLLGVVVYFWQDLLKLASSLIHLRNPALQRERLLIVALMTATIPGAIAGLLFEHKAEHAFRSPALIACNLIALGIALAAADYRGKGKRTLENMTLGKALLIGLAQSLALLPGVSRSGITITVALALGFERRAAARFSFLMSVPIIAGAGFLKAKTILHSPDHAGLALAFTAAAVSGLLAIWTLMKYVQSHRYVAFSVYRWILGAFILLHPSSFE